MNFASLRFRKWWETGWNRVRLAKLKYEFQSSRKFQRECEDLGCVVLAELEQHHRLSIEEKIRQLHEAMNARSAVKR